DLPRALGARALPGGRQPGLRGGRVGRRGAGGHLRRLARRELRGGPRHGRVPRLPDERLRQAAGGDAVRAPLRALQPERLAGGGGVGARGGVAGVRALLRADVHVRGAGVRDAAVGARVDRGEAGRRRDPFVVIYSGLWRVASASAPKRAWATSTVACRAARSRVNALPCRSS